MTAAPPLLKGLIEMLNMRQRRFCELYCGECKGNASEAMKRAGYAPKYAATNADKILKNTNVRAYIEEINAEITKSNIATIEDIQAFWTEILNNPREETKDRLRASELLAKCKGMFNNDW